MLLIKVGIIHLKPTKIISMMKKDRNSLCIPSQISNRRASSFLSKTFMILLKNSSTGLMDDLLFTSITKRRNKLNALNCQNEKGDGDLQHDIESSNYVCDDASWNINAGKQADKDLYPVLHRFKITISNKQTIDQLLNELIKIKPERKNGIKCFDGGYTKHT